MIQVYRLHTLGLLHCAFIEVKRDNIQQEEIIQQRVN